LREVAAHRGVSAWMVDRADELRPEWIEGKKRVGVSAGASAPEVLVQQVIARLKEMGAIGVSELSGIVENVTFPLPKGLSGTVTAKAPEVGPPRG
jgi:4-hydroxy-3-methylbut-2-enyl diphosphate reductase